MSILDLEIATQFGALDTDALTDGGALHAHALRQLAMSSHRLAERGGPMVQLMWDSSTDVAESETIGGALLGYAVGQSWIPLYVGPVGYPKKPNARTATAKILLEYANGSDVFVCVQTSQADLTSDLAAPDVHARRHPDGHRRGRTAGVLDPAGGRGRSHGYRDVWIAEHRHAGARASGRHAGQ